MNNISKMKTIPFVLLISVCTIGSAQKVSSIYDSDYDFSGPRSYDWSQSTKAKMRKFVNVPYASKEIIRYFKEYGYELKEGNSELIVELDIDRSKSMSIQKSNKVTRTGVRTRQNPSGVVTVTKPTAVQEYTGTFTLKLINPKTKEAVWLATAKDDLEGYDDVEKRQKRTKKIIKKMFKKFPGK